MISIRSLFEGMAVAHWVSVNPALAEDRFRKHMRHSASMWNRQATRRTRSRGIERSTITEAEEEAEYKKLFGPWGETSSGVGCRCTQAHRRDRARVGRWRTPDELRFMFAVAHADNTETMHTTAMSLTSGHLCRTDLDGLRTEAGPSIRQVDRALLGALWPWAHILGLAADYFDVSMGADRIDDEFINARAPFHLTQRRATRRRKAERSLARAAAARSQEVPRPGRSAGTTG